jgi:transcriptional regulator with XRE-family HTH domain
MAVKKKAKVMDKAGNAAKPQKVSKSKDSRLALLIKAIRASGKSQGQLSKESGVSQTTISFAVNGKKTSWTPALESLAKHLGVHLGEAPSVAKSTAVASKPKPAPTLTPAPAVDVPRPEKPATSIMSIEVGSEPYYRLLGLSTGFQTALRNGNMAGAEEIYGRIAANFS